MRFLVEVRLELGSGNRMTALAHVPVEAPQEHFGVDSMGYGAWAQYWGAAMAADSSVGMRFADLHGAAVARW